MQVRNIYFYQTPTPNGVELTNKNLKFSAANHIGLSYDLYFNKNWRFKTDLYYQALSKILVENKTNSWFFDNQSRSGLFH